MAFAQWYKKTGGVTFTFMGDGAINQGTHNEALNLASLYKLPVIWVIENNGVAMGTQIEPSQCREGPGQARQRLQHAVLSTSMGMMLIRVIEGVRRSRRPAPVAGGGPTYFSANTYRFRGHSMSDAMKYRTKEEMEQAKSRDPISPVRSASAREGSAERRSRSITMQEEVVSDLVNEATHRGRRRSAPAAGRPVQ